ncbi:MAG: Orotate phosphoribosyltransferase [Alphaproteobacteria bacterium MarineAlpha6_Bin4]|nr:MAG: Orotate phosphoribosyltransferase [Alphaproteobacteria bacterium MarineAlpha6_Bin3]PPR37901.1 MAG: Orotate phosphoribosyltransferase [Alphaproteobacteria bacterium MarineAlpha6_Bin4]|tara:strand:+ start:3476 stop:4105 length:630 start_codon:yes stop_codon:yes gene_type:complete
MNLENFKNKTAKILLEIKAINIDIKKHFKLTSGKFSPVYVDCRKIISHLKERRMIIDMACKLLKKEVNLKKIDFIAGGETAGIPYASLLSEKLNKPMIYIRKKPKGFGKLSQIEGEIKKKSKVLLVEDLSTDGKSKINFCNAIKKAGGNIKDIFVIFNYGIYSDEIFRKNNLKLHFLTNWKAVINNLKKKKNFKKEEILEIEKFLFKDS